MKQIINTSLTLALLFVITLCFTACNDDEEEVMPDKPQITLTEVGHDNAKQCHPGHDLHLEADIVAVGLIQRIDVEIHQSEGATFEIEQAYTAGKYIGVRNTQFHEHIGIPEDAPLGSYHLHFTVTDALGQQTTVESSLEITEDNGTDEDDHPNE